MKGDERRLSRERKRVGWVLNERQSEAADDFYAAVLDGSGCGLGLKGIEGERERGRGEKKREKERKTKNRDFVSSPHSFPYFPSIGDLRIATDMR